jgi:hypothetical protein
MQTKQLMCREIFNIEFIYMVNLKISCISRISGELEHYRSISTLMSPITLNICVVPGKNMIFDLLA